MDDAGLARFSPLFVRGCVARVGTVGVFCKVELTDISCTL
jgi:hypothetical protein